MSAKTRPTLHKMHKSYIYLTGVASHPMENVIPCTDALTSLRRRWFAFAVFGALTVLGGYAFLASRWTPAHAARWLGPALAFWGYLLVAFWRGLPDNVRRRDGRLLASLGPGNSLTLLRGASIALLAGFLLLPPPTGYLAWVPASLFTFVALGDFLDGYLARISDRATRLGEKLDLALDGWGTLVASTLSFHYGQVPAWFLVIGLARYLFLAGIWLRKWLGKPVYPLEEKVSRRALAGVMMTFIAVMLWPLFSPPETYLAAILFALPSLVGFTRDWLVVSGGLSSLAKVRRGRFIKRVSGGLSSFQPRIASWMALVLRLLTAGFALYLALSRIIAAITPSGQLLPAGLALNGIWVAMGLQGLGALLIALGAAGRLGALALLFGVGLQLRQAPLAVEFILLIVGATALFFFGTGAYSTWRPEERLIHTRLGEVK